MDELKRAEAAYRVASPEQLYLAVRRYTDILQRFSKDMVRRRRQRPSSYGVAGVAGAS